MKLNKVIDMLVAVIREVPRYEPDSEYKEMDKNALGRFCMMSEVIDKLNKCKAGK